MTGYIRKEQIVKELILEEMRTKNIMRNLFKAILILIAVSIILSALLSVSRKLKVCYSVDDSTVTVKCGDTLWKIASENIGQYPGNIRNYLAEICRKNNISDIDTICIGDEITVPVYQYRFA